MKTRNLAGHYRIDDPRAFRLSEHGTDDVRGPVRSKEQAAAALPASIERLSRLQDVLYAQNRWALLLVFQAMDAGGKDSAIKHIMSGVNPQGCRVYSFKTPSPDELGHDFLWRCSRCLPERGGIAVFNRSYYEEVLVVRVHPELLEAQRIPEPLTGPRLWKERFEDINAFERHLARSGTVIRKFFLHISKEEQRRRFLKRLDEPSKNWKFAAGDVRDRRHWNAYQAAYEDMIRHTSTPGAPWFVIPADHKWYARHVVVSAVIDALESLDLAYPAPGRPQRAELRAIRAQLES